MHTEEESELVEKELKSHNFITRDENVNINVIYNIDLKITTFTITIYCPLMGSNHQKKNFIILLTSIKIILKNIITI
ncbi:hypothetical protein [Methanobacterium sp. ACI-7]|uniref:hypothetical protein n=1 Tax=unclassified Methanobacterium TaxID=2627676 RepID=UPI0039C14617